MAVRMTGLVSNMDTESIIKELMKAQRTKATKIENKQKKLTWTQDKWKELNTKIYALYTDSLSKMRLQGNYATNKATSSDETKVSVTASTSAPEGAHSIQITQLASSQYVTSNKIATSGITQTSKLVGDLGMTSGTIINISSGTGTDLKTAALDIDANTTVADFVQKCKDAGVNANYDATQKRIFISSKESGVANNFTITSSSYSSSAGLIARNSIRGLIGYSEMSTANKTKMDAALESLRGASDTDLGVVFGGTYDEATATSTQKTLKSAVDTLNTALETKAKATAKTLATTEFKTGIKDAIIAEGSYNGKDYTGVYSGMSTTAWSETQTQYNDATMSLTDAKAAADDKANGVVLTAEQETLAKAYASYQTNLDAKVNTLVATDMKLTPNVDGVTALTTSIIDNGYTDAGGTLVQSKLADLQVGLRDDVYEFASAAFTASTSATTELDNLGLNEIDAALASAGQAAAGDGTGMIIIKAADSIINLNGAILTGESNTVVANGLTINLKNVTATNEKLSLNVTNDTQATYDMVKGFITSYNTLLKEMNTLYSAKTAKGYDPLTDDEKSAMTDDQIEKWETKIKDSLLRRDSTLESLMNSMKTSLTTSVEVDGRKYSLSTFGIQTSTDYTENGLLHIYGDKADSTYSDKTDKLMAALQTDPETVAKAISGIAKNLYDTMTDKMKTSSLNSALTFYNDKQMAKTQTEYSSRLGTLEDRLQDIEDRYYKQFSTMETAMAKLNSQQSSLAGLLGTSS